MLKKTRLHFSSKRNKLILSSIIISVLLITFVLSFDLFGKNNSPIIQEATSSSCDGNAPGMSNPAAEYCGILGYSYSIKDTELGQSGICILPDRTECDEWEFFSGKCGVDYNYCFINGYSTMTKTDGNNPYSIEYAVCFDKGAEIGSASELSGVEDKATRGIRRTLLPNNEIFQKTTQASFAPAYFDWRNNNGDWTTSVKDQGICGSCWAFAAVGAIEAAHNIYNNNPNLDLDLAEEYLVSDCHADSGDNAQTCCGGYEGAAMSFIRDEGIPDEGCMPYVDGISTGCSCGEDFVCSSICTYHTGVQCSDRTCSDRCSNYASRLKYIVNHWSVLDSNEGIKNTIYEDGPVTAGMGIDSPFGGHFEGDIYRCTDDSSTNHAVVIVGYSDTGNPATSYWIVKNSWGATWNGNGYFKLGFNECSINNWVRVPDMTPPAPVCGDGSCNGVETCSSCPQDCGPCPVVCGDGRCDAGENCDNCYQDCIMNCPYLPPDILEYEPSIIGSKVSTEEMMI